MDTCLDQMRFSPWDLLFQATVGLNNIHPQTSGLKSQSHEIKRMTERKRNWETKI